MLVRRHGAAGKMATVGVLAAGAAAALTAPGSAQAATIAPVPASTATWNGWETSPVSATRKLAAVTPTTATATVGIVVDPTKTGQKWLGVGATLTDSSLNLLTNRTDAAKLLYDPTSASGARLNLLRLPMSATDFSTKQWVFGWNTKTKTLTAPTEATNAAGAVTVVKGLRSDLAVVGTPWTAPLALKTSGSLNGGALIAGNESTYADMLYAQASWYVSKGVPLKYMTLGNEPGLSDSSYPTMTMTDAQMAKIATAASAKLKSGGVALWAVDHNFSDRGRVDTALSSAPNAYAGAAFHCYLGSSTQMKGLSVPSVVTECTSSLGDDPAGTFAYDAKVLVQDAVDSGSTGLMMWNLALNKTGGPKLAGGCVNCRGLVQVDPATGTITPQPEFSTLAHLSRAADPGATVVDTDVPSGLPVVAFKNTDNSIGVFGVNTSGADQVISVRVANGAERRFTVGANEMFTFRGAAGTPELTLSGKLIRSTTGDVYYVDLTGTRHLVGSTGVYDCLGGTANFIENVPVAQIAVIPQGDSAACPVAAVKPVTDAVGGVLTSVSSTLADLTASNSAAASGATASAAGAAGAVGTVAGTTTGTASGVLLPATTAVTGTVPGSTDGTTAPVKTSGGLAVGGVTVPLG